MNSSTSKQPFSQSLLIATLCNKNYIKLLSAQIIAAFGDRINQTALLSIIVYKLGNTPKYSADIMFWGALPSVVLGLFAVALIDRCDRRQTMIISDTGRAFLAVSLPLLMIYFDHHYVIYVVVFLMGIFTAIFAPSRLAILPNLVPSELLMSANAISSQAGTVASMIVMPLAGWLVEKLGSNSSFYINAATYLISASFVWRLRPFANPTKEGLFTTPLPKLRKREEFKEGVMYTWKTKPVLFNVCFYALTQWIVAIFMVCFTTYSVDVLGQTVGGTTLLFLALALGMAAGAIVLICFSKKAEDSPLTILMMAGCGLGMLLLSRVYHPWGAGIILFGIGLCAVTVLVPMDTFLQKHVPDTFRGRVFVVRGILGGIGFLITLQFSKGIIYQFGLLQTLQLIGFTSILIGSISAWLMHCLKREYTF